MHTRGSKQCVTSRNVCFQVFTNTKNKFKIEKGLHSTNSLMSNDTKRIYKKIFLSELDCDLES